VAADSEAARQAAEVDGTWPPAFARKAACAPGYGMCVSVKHGLVIVSGDNKLHLHSLATGAPLAMTVVKKGFFSDKIAVENKTFGSNGSGKGQFNFACGGLCVSPDGDSVLVAEYHNNRVQQVRIVDGSWVRFVGAGVLKWPQYVDCNADVIVVSEGIHRISVLSWADGSGMARFGSYGSGPGRLDEPHGVRLLADGSGLVVADGLNYRLCVFRLSGEFVAAVGSREQGLYGPNDVLECTSDGSFIVANHWGHSLAKISRDVPGTVYGVRGSGNGEFDHPTALAALPDGGLVVREWLGNRFQVFSGPAR
jgi:hypothetical protein